MTTVVFGPLSLPLALTRADVYTFRHERGIDSHKVYSGQFFVDWRDDWREHFDPRGEGDRMRLRVLLLLVSGCMLWSCAQQSVEPIRSPDWLKDSPTPYVLNNTQQCGVNKCGMPIQTYCAVSCKEDQVATCSCDCTSRLLGVCTELKSSCTCADPTELVWWTTWLPF
jgi:hypothetical protein